MGAPLNKPVLLLQDVHKFNVRVVLLHSAAPVQSLAVAALWFQRRCFF